MQETIKGISNKDIVFEYDELTGEYFLSQNGFDDFTDNILDNVIVPDLKQIEQLHAILTQILLIENAKK